ncbi:C-methyltransferase [Arcobacter nitrofigilis DSM 7299]|uniref:C-methyltransferase n=1 Tax=Arcobacter nitrofigilis (strain ATCC 33309 / DSM 7299 / CCUG 15893 / LMG 7604 / NCTC 12251 / CI) TaxID=572480 RepID=D5V6D7_ARCNC|nr:class I SAM-dependent methyltransferase [Arcobacter nitrofigilis]ADG94207.1 C-methyltransferase [Arcobacter nitrofigilis DSM 7299]
MAQCLICDLKVEKFIDFGQQPIANGFLTESQFNNEYFFKMEVGFCPNCKMVQLLEQPDREQMFHENYAFFSSTSDYMKEHFKNFAYSVIEKQLLAEDSLVVEIGCNDGIMIENFLNKNIPHLGVEPSKNVADIARSKGINVTSEFFDSKLALDVIEKYGKADAILSANVMCHIPYMHSIFEGIEKLLKDDGIFSFEDPYAADIVQKASFDQIYDEHTFLFSVMSVSYLANIHGLEVIDVEPQVTHGGSMRYTLAHKGRKEVSINVQNQIQKEKELGLDNIEAYNNFTRKVNIVKDDLMKLLNELKEKNKKVVAYGATSKSTTVTNFFGITPEHLEFICDTTPTKHNKFSPGAHIPVIPYEKFKDSKPDYVLLFAWNHAKEIMEKEKEYMEANGIKWIMYVPDVKVID